MQGRGCVYQRLSNVPAAFTVADQEPPPQNVNEVDRKVKAHISNQAAHKFVQ